MQFTLKLTVLVFAAFCLFGPVMQGNNEAAERNSLEKNVLTEKQTDRQNANGSKSSTSQAERSSSDSQSSQDSKTDRSDSIRPNSTGEGSVEKKKGQSDFIPLIDSLAGQSSELKKLDRTDPIWVTADRKEVLLGGMVCLREGLLEFFACREQSKEHESIITLKIKPHLIHAGLLIIGARQGSPARFDPEVIPPSGEEIEVVVRWIDEKGNRQEARAQEWVLENKSGKEMSSPWVFTGGLFGKDSKGKRYYLADISGEIFGVSNFPGSVLDVPFVSSSNNDELFYQPNTKKIPPIGTQVTLVLKRTGKFHQSDKKNK